MTSTRLRGLVVIASALALALLPTPARAQVRQTGPGGRARATPPAGVVDLGYVLAGTRVSAQATVTNTAAVDLRYVGVEGSVPSLEAIVSPGAIGPGGEARVSLRLDAAAFAANARLDAKLLFDGANGRVVVPVPLYATLESAFTIEPATVDLGGAFAGETRHVRLRIVPTSREDADFTEVVAPPELAVTRAADEIAEGRHAAVLDVAFTAPYRLGPYGGELRLRLKDARRLDALVVPVRGHVRSDVSIAPGEVAFRRVLRGRPAAPAEVAVRAIGTRPLAVLRAAARGPVTATLAAGPGGATVVRVALDPATPAGAVAAEVLLYVDRPEEPLVAIPVSADVHDPYVPVPPAAFLEARPDAPDGATLVELCAEPGEPLEVAGIECDVPCVEATLVTQPARTLVRLRLKPGAAAPPSFAGTLRVRTRSALEPEVVVPIAGRGPR